MSSALPKHEIKLRVRYAETDQMGVVYYANYYVWMELGRSELVRSRGVQYKDIEDNEALVLAVIESSCRYLRPARYDQEISIKTELAEVTPRILAFQYEMSRSASGELLATGATRHMWLNREWRPARLPERYVAMLQSTAVGA